MEVILLEKIKNLGNLGDKVSVRPGYGRNYLLPRRKALPATAANVAEFETRRAEYEKNQLDVLAKAEARASRLSEITAVISCRAGGEGKLFGSVGPADIAAAVSRDSGEELQRQEVRMPDGPIRHIGEYSVDLHLHTDVDTTLKVHVVAEEE